MRRCLRKLKVPLSGIWGEADATTGKFMAERRDLLRAIDPYSDFVTIPNAGHWVQYEAPDAFNDALEEVLSKGRGRVEASEF